MGARGNSGVILSQFLRGFSEGCEEKRKSRYSRVSTSFEKKHLKQLIML